MVAKTLSEELHSLSSIYLPPMASLDGVPGNHHHGPELGERLLQTLVVLPRGQEGAVTHKYTLLHMCTSLTNLISMKC